MGASEYGHQNITLRRKMTALIQTHPYHTMQKACFHPDRLGVAPFFTVVWFFMDTLTQGHNISKREALEHT